MGHTSGVNPNQTLVNQYESTGTWNGTPQAFFERYFSVARNHPILALLEKHAGEVGVLKSIGLQSILESALCKLKGQRDITLDSAKHLIPAGESYNQLRTVFEQLCSPERLGFDKQIDWDGWESKQSLEKVRILEVYLGPLSVFEGLSKDIASKSMTWTLVDAMIKAKRFDCVESLIGQGYSVGQRDMKVLLQTRLEKGDSAVDAWLQLGLRLFEANQEFIDPGFGVVGLTIDPKLWGFYHALSNPRGWEQFKAMLLKDDPEKLSWEACKVASFGLKFEDSGLSYSLLFMDLLTENRLEAAYWLLQLPGADFHTKFIEKGSLLADRLWSSTFDENLYAKMAIFLIKAGYQCDVKRLEKRLVRLPDTKAKTELAQLVSARKAQLSKEKRKVMGLIVGAGILSLLLVGGAIWRWRANVQKSSSGTTKLFKDKVSA